MKNLPLLLLLIAAPAFAEAPQAVVPDDPTAIINPAKKTPKKRIKREDKVMKELREANKANQCPGVKGDEILFTIDHKRQGKC